MFCRENELRGCRAADADEEDDIGGASDVSPRRKRNDLEAAVMRLEDEGIMLRAEMARMREELAGLREELAVRTSPPERENGTNGAESAAVPRLDLRRLQADGASEEDHEGVVPM